MFAALAILIALAAAIALAALADRMRLTAVPDPARRIGCIDGLRGYLALGVMVHHFVIWLGVLAGLPWRAPALALFVNLGQGAVTLFFMVTGALFYGKILGGARSVDWRALYLSRAFRLVPLFWFAFLLVNLIVATRHGLDIMSLRYLERAAHWLLFLDLPPLGDADAGRIVAYAPWTLTYEWLCYFTLPLVALLLGPARRAAQRLALLAALAAAGSAAMLLLPQSGWHSFIFFTVPFLGGMIAFELTRHPAVRALAQSPAAALAGALALAFALTAFPTSFDPLPCAVLALFFIPVVAGNSYFGAFATRPSIVLGEASYGIYLLHGIVLYLALVDAGPLMDAHGPAPFWAALPLLVLAVVGAAIALHEVLEKPAIRFGRALARRRKAAPADVIVPSSHSPSKTGVNALMAGEGYSEFKQR